MRDSLKSPKFWKLIYLATLFVSAICLHPTLKRLTDGDDGWHYYDGGMRSWSEVLHTAFIPPEKKPFLFTPYRPLAIYFFPKIAWEIGPSFEVFKISFWFIGWLSAFCFGWGIYRALSLGIRLAPGTPWLIGAIFWLAAPNMMMYGMPLPSFVGFGLGYLIIGLLSDLGLKNFTPRQRKIRLALIGLAGFIACHTHESLWLIYAWFGAWLFILHYLKLLKPSAPRPWWPFAFLLTYILIYRSFNPNNMDVGWGMSREPADLLENLTYFLLTLLNGLAKPLPEWLGIKRSIDVTVASFPFAFLFTLAAIFLAVQELRTRKQKTPSLKGPLPGRQRMAEIGALLSLLGMAIVQTAPYWHVVTHRFIYFARLGSGFVAAWFVVLIARGKKIPLVPALLFLVGNALAAHQIVPAWSWLWWNDQDAKGFYQSVVSRPEFKDCSSDQPCCITMTNRGWNRNEWILSWVSGAPKSPPFVPEGTAGIQCAKHLSL